MKVSYKSTVELLNSCDAKSGFTDSSGQNDDQETHDHGIPPVPVAALRTTKKSNEHAA
jgi:hypothetical protein